MLDLSTAHAARIAIADKHQHEAFAAASAALAEAHRTFAAAITKARDDFNEESLASSAEFAGQTDARLSAHKQALVEAEKALNGDEKEPDSNKTEPPAPVITHHLPGTPEHEAAVDRAIAEGRGSAEWGT